MEKVVNLSDRKMNGKYPKNQSGVELCQKLCRLVGFEVQEAEEDMITRIPERQAAACLSVYKQLRERRPDLIDGLSGFYWGKDFRTVLVMLDPYAIGLEGAELAQAREIESPLFRLTLPDGGGCGARFCLDDTFS